MGEVQIVLYGILMISLYNGPGHWPGKDASWPISFFTFNIIVENSHVLEHPCFSINVNPKCFFKCKKRDEPILQGAHAGIIRYYNVLFSFLHL